MEFDLEDPFTCSSDELFAVESDHSPIAGDLLSRRSAVSFILHAQYNYGFDQHLAYLAVNYVDRFLSKNEIPREKKPWVVKLLAIACLSLASKMKHSDLSLSDLQREEGFIFDSNTVHRMELLVLSTLDWRMRSITPFSFLRFFLHYFPNNLSSFAIKHRASQILLRAQNELNLLEFKPSLIAAAALLSATLEILPEHYASFQSSISSFEFVNKERLWVCCSAISEMGPPCDVAADDSSADTPLTVLDGDLYTSSESERTVGSSSDGSDRKKRRLPHFIEN